MTEESKGVKQEAGFQPKPMQRRTTHASQMLSRDELLHLEAEYFQSNENNSTLADLRVPVTV